MRFERLIFLAALALAALVLVSLPGRAQSPAQGGANDAATMPIFDAHMHYNQEPNPFYSLDKVLEVFKRNKVTGILATSRPTRARIS